jgi:hypothetical protein
VWLQKYTDALSENIYYHSIDTPRATFGSENTNNNYNDK